VDDEIPDDREVRQRLHADLAGVVVTQEGGTGELRRAVHHHAAASADAHVARPAERQGAVLLVLDVLEGIQHDPVLVIGNVVGLGYGVAVLPGAVPGDGHFYRLCLDSHSTSVAPSRRAYPPAGHLAAARP